MIRGVLALLTGALGMLLPVMGEAQEVDFDTWETRAFQVSEWLLREVESEQRGKKKSNRPSAEELWQMDDLPREDEPEGRWIEVLKRNSEKLKKAIGGDSSVFPEGSVLAYDKRTQTLAIRSTREFIQWGEELERYSEKVPHLPVLRVDVVECDAGKVRQMVEDAAPRREHGEIWRHVMEWIENKQAVMKETVRAETRSGQKVETGAGKELEEVSKVTVDDAGRVELEKTARVSGLRVEMDAVLGPDGRSVDLSYEVCYDSAPLEWRKETIVIQPGSSEVDVSVGNGREVRIATAGTFLDGDVRLIGAWPLVDKPGVMQAAFLSCKVVPIRQPQGDAALAKVVEKYADRLESVAPGEATAKLPVREFFVPSDLFDWIAHEEALKEAPETAEAPQDPFAAGASSSYFEVERRKFISPRRALETAGITFPEEAAVLFSRKKGRLWMRNSQANLDAMDDYLATIRCCRRPSVLSATLRVIQAEAGLVRELLRKSEENGDHSELWKQIRQGIAEGKIVAVDSSRLECRSGQRARLQAGLVYKKFSPLSFSTEDVKPEKEQESKKQDENANGRRMTAELEEEIAGVEFEMEPVMGPDGHTMDLNYVFIYHFAPPVSNEANDGKQEFFCFRNTAAIALELGRDRLIGVWKPKDGGVAESEVLQAAFLRVDYVEDRPDLMRESPSPHGHEHR